MFATEPASSGIGGVSIRCLLVAALLIAAMLVCITGQYLILAGLVGIATLVGLWKGVLYTTNHPEWVVLPILLIFGVISFSFWDDAVRASLHYGLTAIFCLPLIPRVLHWKLLRKGAFKLYTFYLAFAGFSISYSIAPAYSVARLIEATMIMFALVAIVNGLESAADVDRVLSHYFIGCAILSGIMLVSLVALPRSLCWVSPEASIEPSVLKQMHQMGISVDGIERFQSVYSGPNDVGAIMLVTVGVGIARWTRVKLRERIFIAVAVCSALLSGVLADSRSPFVALFIGISMFLVWRYGIRGIIGIITVFAIGVGILMASGHDFGAYVNRGDVATLTGRTEMWAFVVKSIAEHPILGFGYEVGGAIFDDRFFPLWWGPWDQGPHTSIHNGYLAHAVGVGIPVTIFWLYIMLNPWWSVLRHHADNWDLKRLFFLLMVPILIHNMSEVMADDATGIVGFLFGTLWAISAGYQLVIEKRKQAAADSVYAALPRAVAVLAPPR